MPAGNKWRLSGDYFENCNCDVVCPCLFSTAEPAPGQPSRCQAPRSLPAASGHGDAGALDVRRRKPVFRSVADLQAAINRFLEEHNQQSKAFTWTANPDEIIAAVRRGHQVLDSIH
jgi:hypothetical protein